MMSQTAARAARLRATYTTARACFDAARLLRLALDTYCTLGDAAEDRGDVAAARAFDRLCDLTFADALYLERRAFLLCEAQRPPRRGSDGPIVVSLRPEEAWGPLPERVFAAWTVGAVA